MTILSLLADVLFVGHSLVGPSLPPLVEAALRKMGEPSAVEAQVIADSTLADNWAQSATAEGVDARARLAQRPTDVLILTEAVPVAAQVEAADTAGHIAAFAMLAAEANPDVRIYVYEVWPSLNVGTDVPWREQLTQALPVWEGAVSAAAAKSGLDIRLIPAAQAMGRLADEIAAGKVPEIASIAEIFADDIHPNAKGLYFLAMVHAGAVAGRSPEGLPARLFRAWPSRDAVISQGQAQAFQRIAWESLQAYAPAKAPAVAAEPANAVLLAQDSAAIADPETPAQPAPLFTPVTNSRLSLGLAAVNDWSVQQPFLNVMKTARPWVGHLPGRWGGWEHADLAANGYLDTGGWPKAIPPELTGISTLILTDLPEEAGLVAGRYVLTYAGNGALRIEGSAAVADASPGRILFDYSPGIGAVLLTITATDPGNPVRDIVVVREDRAALLASGAIFNPDWLARIRGVRGLRFMDWMATNNSTLAQMADRPRPADYTYARIGVPMEILVALANELDADPWFTIPHLADDALVRDFAQIAHAGLNPNLRAHVEFSNEVWNWQFAQAVWADEQALARWGETDAWVQFYALRATEVAAIWAQVFADAPDRLVRIIAVQTGWLGLEAQILEAPLVMAEGRTPPAASFDAYAVTGYFSAQLGSDSKLSAVRDWLARSAAAARDSAAGLGLAGTQANSHFAAHRFDLAVSLAAQELRDGSVTGDAAESLSVLLNDLLPYQAAVAAKHGLTLMMYEGGTHVVGLGAQVDDKELTAFFTHLNVSPEMGLLYDDLLAGWRALSDAPFNAYVDTYYPGKWGSWGAMRHLGDDNPRWQALAKGCGTC